MNILRYIQSLPLAALLLGATLGLGSCTKVEPGIFTEDANTRVDQHIAELKAQLTQAEYGWIMDYYPSPFRAYGGYVIGLRFDKEGNVLICSQHKQEKGAQDIVSARSMYTIGSDRSVTLNFSTYNAHLHDFADPGVPHGQGYGSGMEGDHEFILEKPTGDMGMIRLRGKKTNNLIVLRKATEPVVDYLKKSLQLDAQMYATTKMLQDHKDALVGTLAGQKVELTPSFEGFSFLTLVPQEGENKGQSKPIPYVITPQGIRFYEAVSGVSELVWSAADKAFTSSQGDKLIARADPIYPKYAAYLGEYTFSYGNGVRHDVRFEENGRNRYTITGATLPFPITALYDVRGDRFEIQTQKIPNGNLAVWDIPAGEGNLSFAQGLGMYSKLVEGSNPKEYTMVDNGQWGSNIAQSFILWKNSRGVADYPGFPGRIVLPKFTRKN